MLAVAWKSNRLPAARQIERQQRRREHGASHIRIRRRVRFKSRAGALRGLKSKRGIARRAPIGIDARIELNVGSVIAKPEVLEQPCLLQIDADISGCAGRAWSRHPPSRPSSEAGDLVLRRRRVGERIVARVIIELIFPDVRIHGNQGVRIESVLVSRRDTPGQHPLPLVLRELIVGIRNLGSSSAPRTG